MNCGLPLTITTKSEDENVLELQTLAEKFTRTACVPATASRLVAVGPVGPGPAAGAGSAAGFGKPAAENESVAGETVLLLARSRTRTTAFALCWYTTVPPADMSAPKL